MCQTSTVTVTMSTLSTSSYQMSTSGAGPIVATGAITRANAKEQELANAACKDVRLLDFLHILALYQCIYDTVDNMQTMFCTIQDFFITFCPEHMVYIPMEWDYNSSIHGINQPTFDLLLEQKMELYFKVPNREFVTLANMMGKVQNVCTITCQN